jgi:lipopolysaccharide/colanic/teichoic acid biosynthesis glycosyltransferase
MDYRRSKRIFDIVVAAGFLILFSPLILLLSLLVRIFMGSPILFSQRRPGLNEKAFYLYKFRTMLNTYDKRGEPLSDAQRLTRFGKFLRASSLDELPELFNVLKGEMSLVGPRPLLMEYLPYYSLKQRLRHRVRPGITGWAQIHGRNTLSWEKKFDLDVWYVEHGSFLLDIQILFKTVGKIFKREGIHAVGHATMNRFDVECKKDVSQGT